MRQITETQSIRNNKALLIVFIVAMGLPLIGMFLPLILNEARANEDWTGIAIVVVMSVTLFVILKLKTEVVLRETKVSYRSNPFTRGYSELQLKDIKSWEIKNHNWIHGLGYRTNLKGGRMYVMIPGKVLVITMKDGRYYHFGINRPDVVQRFIERNWEENSNRYG